MSKRTLTPPPVGFSAFDGDITKYVGKRANLSVAIVAQELGNEEGLYDWVKRSPDNERDFWLKLFPRIMQKQVEHTASDGIEELVRLADRSEKGEVLDVDFEEIEDAS